MKLNVDGSYSEADNNEGVGMILRDDTGSIIFSTCRFLLTCSIALEAEVLACMEGISLALEWSSAPFILETDCSVAAAMIQEHGTNRSPVTALIGEIKRLLQGRREYGSCKW